MLVKICGITRAEDAAAAVEAGAGALVRLGAGQLHGDEPVSYGRELGRPVIKALSVGAAASMTDDWPAQAMILLDVHDPAKRGGTGRTVDWAAASAVARRRRTILAGGLTPENVADAVARVRPFGIDVSSGVEWSPRVKDHQRIRALFAALDRRSEE